MSSWPSLGILHEPNIDSSTPLWERICKGSSVMITEKRLITISNLLIVTVLIHTLNWPAGGTVWPVQVWTGNGSQPALRQHYGQASSGQPAAHCLPGYSTVGRKSSVPWLHVGFLCSSRSFNDLSKRKKKTNKTKTHSQQFIKISKSEIKLVWNCIDLCRMYFSKVSYKAKKLILKVLFGFHIVH